MRIPEKMRLLREMQKKQDLLSIKGGKSFEDLEIWKTPKKVTEYAGNRKRIHLIHWYAKNRSSLELTDVEKFHFTMLYLSDFDCKFDEIYFTVAIDDMDADPLKEFISDKINELTKYGTAKLHVNFIKNNVSTGELDTWLKLFDFIYDDDEEALLFYSHFKGTGRHNDSKTNLNVKYWAYLLYQGCLIDGWETSQSVLNDKASFGACINEKNIDIEYYKAEFPFWNVVQNVQNRKVYTGTFYWINSLHAKHMLSDRKICKQDIHDIRNLNKRVNTGNYLAAPWFVEYSIPSILNEQPTAYFRNSNKYDFHEYELYNTRHLPEYINKFNNLYNMCMDRKAVASITHSRCILSCIFNNYEKVHEIRQRSPEIDYVMITDDPDLKSDTWTVIHENEYPELTKLSDPIAKCWYVRFHPFEFCPSAQTVFKIDGDMEINKTPEKLFNDFEAGKKDIGFAIHPYRSDVYSEIDEWKRIRPDRAKLAQQKQFFNSKKYKSTGLIESGYLMISHSDRAKEILDVSWKLCVDCRPEGKEASPVDQTLFTYSVHMNFGNGDNFMVYDRHLVSNSYITIMGHNSNIPAALFEDPKLPERTIFNIKINPYYIE